MRAAFLVPLIPVVLAAAGCGSPCEAVCEEMAEYAIECGFDVSDAEVDACLAEQASPSGDERRICRDYGEPTVIRNSWSCSVLERYFDAPPAETAQ